jgi:SWI/SNF-related matrix-associated actin-dependent regulator 1 of chromatin subfamily A
MKITYDKSQFHIFRLRYEFKQERVEFCRTIREAFGWKNFVFDSASKSWMFSDPYFIELLQSKFNDVELDIKTTTYLENTKKRQEEEQKKKTQIDEIKERTDSNIKIRGLKHELYPYQKLGVEFLEASGGRAIIADQMGCIAGDEVIIYNRRGNAKRLELRELYRKFKGGTSNGGRQSWDLSIETKTRSLTPDGLFELNVIKDIIYKGIQTVYCLEAETEEGKKYKIKATEDHRIATVNGWVELKELKKGDQIIVNGDKLKYCDICKKKTPHSTCKYSINVGKCKKCIYRFIRKNKTSDNGLEKLEHYDKNGYIYCSGLYFHPTVINASQDSRTIFKHVLVYEAFLNDVSVEEWKEMCAKNNIPNGALFIDSSKYVIHHKDQDKKNNTIGNLEMLTKVEHAKEHTNQNIRHLTLNIVPSTAKITSIKKEKETDVYDIQMKGENKNFIASGVVVHNCGKTAQSIAYVKYKGYKRILIVAPASVKFSWEMEVKKWTNLKSVVIDSKTNIADVDPDVQIWIVNYDILKKHYKQLSKIKFDCIIGDEATYIKSLTAIRTKIFRQISRDIPSVILLSGTPLLSAPIELFSLLNIINPTEWNNYYDYARKYCAMKQTRWGIDVSGASNIPELHEKIKRCFIRRLKKDVLKELPPTTHIPIPVQLEKEFQTQYDEASDDLARYLKLYAGKQNKEIAKTMQAEKLAQLNILRFLNSMGKVKVAQEIVESIVEGGEKVLVFSCFKKPLEELKKAFGDSAVIITGDTPTAIRGQIVDQFQNNPKVKIFLGGIKSAGIGITLTAGSSVVFIDNSWNPADMSQSEDRISRPGQKAKQLSCYQLFVKDSIDEDMQELLETKQDIFDKVIDGKGCEDQTQKAMEKAIDRIMKRA